MKITVDTNVLVSATFWNGDSNTVLEKVENKEIELVLSKEIIEEFARVLGYKEIQDKIRDKNLEMKRTIEKIISISTIVEPTEKLNIVEEDPEDNKILECAKAGNVDFIISGDNHLLKIKKLGLIKIVSPDEFLKK
ncbi:MAG: putative toxin-antitoxin system toxin component, PIN family [Candidatus Woesearchaeota archaeon]|nr:putative toxin-antitoxin system toxin component, PIN family [Candidatus Woesearchaeota archaeon]